MDRSDVILTYIKQVTVRMAIADTLIIYWYLNGMNEYVIYIVPVSKALYTEYRQLF